jgi:Fe-S cluster biogenesis protein NfuA
MSSEMMDEFKVRFAVDTIARALQSDGTEVKLLGFDADVDRVRIAARLDLTCVTCAMTPDQLQAMVKDMVEGQIGRPVSVQMSEL